MIVLLRGINVGARNRVAMADLRAIVQGLGGTDVRTHLQSGNAVFTAADIGKADLVDGLGRGAASSTAAARPVDRVARALEQAIERRLGLNVVVLVRTVGELAKVVERNPLIDIASNPSRLLVTFLSGEVERDRIADLDPDRFLPDRFALSEREIYVWAPNGASETRLTHAFWEKRLGVSATARNWNTVQRLLELAGGPAAAAAP